MGCWFVAWLVGWLLAGWVAGWAVGWLIGWFVVVEMKKNIDGALDACRARPTWLK